MEVAVVAVAMVFWIGVFMVYFTAQGTTPLEHFFGEYEPLPGDLGHWRETGVDEKTGLLREERRLSPEGASRGYLLVQVRYREPSTGAIVRVEPEQRAPRRRVRKKARD